MTTLSAPPAAGDPFPSLDLIDAQGEHTTLSAQAGGRVSLVYLMRTPTCPVCNSHLRHISRLAAQDAWGSAGLIVITPGAAEEAASVAERHSGSPLRVLASTTAHARLGLAVRGMLQQSGSFVLDPAGRVLHATHATVPTGSFNPTAAQEAVASALQAAR